MLPLFCLRVLLLAAFGQHVKGHAANYKSRSLNPQLDRHETALHSFSPSSSSYLSHLQPRAYFPSPKIPEWRPAQTSPLEQRGFHARQVDGYSQPGSESSYRPASYPLKPKSLQQPQGLVYQASTGPWDLASSQNKNKFGTRVVSSGAIEFHAEPESSQKLRNGAGAHSNIMPPKKEATPPAGVHQTKEIMWNLPQIPTGLSQSRPTVTQSNDVPSQRRTSSQSSGDLQSKEGMWSISSPQRPGVSKPSSDEYKTPTQKMKSPKSSGPLQNKEGMWNLPQSGFAPSRTTTMHSNTMSSQRNVGSPTSVLQSKEMMWNMPQSLSHKTEVPSQREPSSQSSVLQNKEGMWSLPGSNVPLQGIHARSFHPAGLERKMQAPTRSQQQPSLSRKPVQMLAQVPSIQTKGQMQKTAAPGHGSGQSITGHATVSYSSNPPRGRSSQSSPTWDRSESNQKTKGASGMASLTSLYQFDGDRPKLLPSPKRNKA